MSDKKHIMTRPWFAIVWFVFMMVALVLVAFPLQMNFGMMGLAITQIIILLFALVPILISKQRFKDIFPVKFSGIGHLVRQTLGTMLMWAGTYIFILATNIIMMYFFPQAYSDVSEGLADFFYSVPLVVGFIIVAVFPAVCEEALHRGYILSTMKNIKSDALTVLIMGIIFGAFHLDPIRFLPTALLGAVATYVMIKTKNILMPVLLHFINNAISFLIGTLNIQPESAPETVEVVAYPIEQLGGLVIGAVVSFAVVVPFLLVGGAALLRPKVKKDQDKEKYMEWKKKKIRMSVYSVLIAGAILITGFGIMFISTIINPPFLMNKEVQMTQAEGAQEVVLVVASQRTYMVDYSFSAEKGQIHVVIADENDEIHFDIIASEIWGNSTLSLDPGEYTIRYQLIPEDAEAYLEEHGYAVTDYSGEHILDVPENENEPVMVSITMTLL